MKHVVYRMTLILISFLFFSTHMIGQYATRTGHVYVKSVNSIKNIEADNYQVSSQLNIETGEINFTGLLRSFEFRLGALDRAFNAKDINVSAYPKVRFEGMVANITNKVNFDVPGEYKVRVKGTLFIWDEKRITSANGYITIREDGKIDARSNFIMTIEEGSVNKMNQIMKEKLPAGLNINTNTLGISRDVNINLDMTYKLPSW